MCLVPANTASRACVWLPHDRVRGCRGLALALMGASRPIPGATIDKPPDPCAHGCRNLTLLGKWWGFCSMRSLATACRRRVAPLLVQFPPFAGGKVAVRGGKVAVRGGEVAVRGGEVAVRGGEVAVRGGEVAVRGGEAPKPQTTSAKNANNGVSWAKWSAFWAKLSRTWCVVRTRTSYCER